jgi:hypothetical protein
MLAVEYKVNEKSTFKIDLEDVKEAFQFVAYCDTIFGVDCCGNCKGPNLRLLYRTAQEYQFYSVQCKDCHYELKFGQTKVGQMLYPKGWEEPYNGGGESQDETEPAQEEKPAKATKPAGKPKDRIAF